jgi:CYTH domain-containing protein
MSRRAGKYARYEFERRFLVERLPEPMADRGSRITDLYIENTRLRLRRMEPLAHGETVFKLGQKAAPAPPNFSQVTITNIYLSHEEYDVFAKLPGYELRKTRYSVGDDGRNYGVDVFEGNLSGLILAELGFESSKELKRKWPLPPWVSREVSDDVRFTGGALARLSTDDAATLLRQLSDKR